MKKALTPKQRLFVHEYLVDLNATQAAIRSGYSKKTAYSIGQALLKKHEISKLIEAARKKHEDRLEITRDKWLQELAVIGFSDLANYFTIEEGGAIVPKPFEQMPPGTSRALEAIEETRRFEDSNDENKPPILVDKIKFKLHSKLDALEKIGKHLGYLKDKIDIPGLPELGQALYEISDKFLPTARGKQARMRSDG